jgi:hypothetical protein
MLRFSLELFLLEKVVLVIGRFALERPDEVTSTAYERPVPKTAVAGFRYASGQHRGQARWSPAKRSGSNGGLGLLVRLPIPGKQVGDFVSGVIWKRGQHVSEPGLWIDVVHLAGFDQGIDGRGTMATESDRAPTAS